jgi:hypothetical protein
MSHIQNYNHSEHLAIDKVTVLFKGKVAFKWDIQKKHKHFRIKTLGFAHHISKTITQRPSSRHQVATVGYTRRLPHTRITSTDKACNNFSLREHFSDNTFFTLFLGCAMFYSRIEYIRVNTASSS